MEGLTLPVTIDDLATTMAEVAGEPLPTGDVLDTTFVDLGYDSVVMMEVIAQLERANDVRLGDDAVREATTPRALLTLINDAKAGTAASGRSAL